MEAQRKALASLVDERNREAGTSLAALKAERASLAAQARRIETEAAPIRYVAELIGADRTASAQDVFAQPRPEAVSGRSMLAGA